MPGTILTFRADRGLVRVLSDAGLALEPDLPLEDAMTAVRERRVAALVHGLGDPAADAIVAKLQAEPALDCVAVVALVPRARFGYVETGFASGADDVCGIEEGPALAERLRALGARAPPADRSPAVVADPDPRRRATIGRLLRRSGFDIRFAGDALELARACDAELAQAGGCLVADAETGIASLEAGATISVPWVLCADGADLDPLGRELAGRDPVALYDRSHPVQNVLFLLNELSNPGVSDVRASRRVLWASPIHFRRAGHDGGGWGMGFNVNRGGLYLRTLGALAPGTELWLELQPSGASRRVHVEARVAWLKPFRMGGRPLAPPGMGLAFTCATPSDQTLLDEGYERLLEGNGLQV